MDKMREMDRILGAILEFVSQGADELLVRRIWDRVRRELLNTKCLAPSAWISCAERLPTEADGFIWAWDADIKAPAIEIWSQVVMFRDRYDYTHWMPTGLTRPQPPEEK